MNHIVFTPIEYNIRALIIESIAKPLIQPDTYGPTEKMITRFKTIHDFPRQKTWDFSYKVYNDKAEKFYILETLDGKSFRCLAPRLNDSGKIYSVKKTEIAALLSYISNTTTAPTRIANYQNIAIKQSIGNLFVPKPLALESFEEKISDIPSHAIKHSISIELNKLLNTMISKEFKDIGSSADINNILHDARFGDIFYETVLGQYSKVMLMEDLAKYTAGEFPFSEILSSFMVDLQSTTRSFMKELHDGYGRDSLKQTVFSLAKTEKMRIIKKKLEDVIESALNLSVKDSSNIYAVMYYKYMVLNYS
jgi:hypothetical protein